MERKERDYGEYNESNTSRESIPVVQQDGHMGKEDRRLMVLHFLDQHDLALPQRVIYRNMKFDYGITFSYSSVDGYLDEFVKEGLCRRVQPAALENRKLVDLDQGQGQAYYLITSEGKAYLKDQSPDTPSKTDASTSAS